MVAYAFMSNSFSRMVGHCATGSPVRENPVIPCSVIRIVRVRLRLRNKGANSEPGEAGITLCRDT